MTLPTTNLGKTGLTVSRLCLGTMTFGLQTDEETSRHILDTAAAERYQERYWHDREFNTVEALRTVADLAGLSLTTIAVAWVLSNPIITAPIIGASRPEQLTDNLKAVELKLDDNLKQKLDELTAEYRRGDSLR
ncbi:aldo/keto reductase [Nostoc sp. UHCC 0302]|uniref:aldo/keto reductase n=1 Tax=Nostoc sp. UHCC 0302 TaxID=3134896 RepID=UPI00311CC0BB